MPRFAYVNGRYRPHAEAAVHIEDRGYQFADGVYEVVPVDDGALVDEDPHLDRLGRSLGALEIPWPLSRANLALIGRELVRRNGIRDGLIYIQVTRGVAPRDHGFPAKARPSLVMTTRRRRPLPAHLFDVGAKVITIPDIRWRRCDIKSIGLLPNVLGKEAARRAGAFEAWQVDDAGFITEGTSTNAWIVDAAGRLVTRDPGAAILSGVTRRALLALVAGQGITVEERPFSLAEARAAREAFLTSSTSLVMPVTAIDGAPVGSGRPGPVATALRQLYAAHVDAEAGRAP
jgi:D-alanine transaminase